MIYCLKDEHAAMLKSNISLRNRPRMMAIAKFTYFVKSNVSELRYLYLSCVHHSTRRAVSRALSGTTPVTRRVWRVDIAGRTLSTSILGIALKSISRDIFSDEPDVSMEPWRMSKVFFHTAADMQRRPSVKSSHR